MVSDRGPANQQRETVQAPDEQATKMQSGAQQQHSTTVQRGTTQHRAVGPLQTPTTMCTMCTNNTVPCSRSCIASAWRSSLSTCHFSFSDARPRSFFSCAL